MFEVQQNLMKGLFLLILAVSANFVGNLLGCKTQKLLTDNILAKQVVLVFLIYFTVDLTSDKVIHPLETMKYTLLLWIFYLLFTRMNMIFTMILFILLLMMYVMNNYKEYLVSLNEDENKEMIEMIDQIVQMIPIVIVVLLVIGFGMYFMKQRKEHKKNFKYLTFFFGSKKCDSIK